MRIEMLDGGNGTATANVLETWECYGCWLVSTNWNSTALSYKTNDPVIIELSIQPDNCVQTGASAGLGTPNFKQTRGTNSTGGGSKVSA